jgi:DNA mismatch repair protein MutS2
LAEFAAFSASKSLALGLQPSEDFELVHRRQKETSEAYLLLSLSPSLTIGGARDVRGLAKAASRDAVLDPTELLDIKSTLISARSIRRVLENHKTDAPLLSDYAAQMEPIHGIIDAISKALDERGNVLDNASSELASIRRELRIGRDRLTSKLQRLVGDPDILHMLQEPIITQRDGRFVIPLRAEFKGRIDSVIHDRSASGATLFIEPLSIVDLNNQVRELELAERDEVRRILAGLSKMVGDHQEALTQTVEALASLDLALAKARYAEAIQANEPILKPWPAKAAAGHPGSTLRLISARHPRLQADRVVPVDLILSEENYALVITGPNTGGKTVALKTAGLLALMAQCGLHLPATSGSEVSVFEGVYADIGDEQSIEQSLSTFSSHISNIIRILKRANWRSLVLLDELGAGTDPQEGAALAQALLSEFLGKRATILVATHYPELKAYAHITAGVSNASVEFDPESLKPTYHLVIGLPGRSNALLIAQRLGLKPSIIERARARIPSEELQADGLLDEIHRQRDAARRALADTSQAKEEVLQLRSELQDRLEAIEDERRSVLEQARREAEQELASLREEIRKLRRRLAAAGQPLEVLEEIKGSVEELEEEYTQPVARESQDEALQARALQLGDRVFVRTIAADGVITGLGQDQAEVQIGRLRVRAGLDELSRPNDLEKPAERKARSRKRQAAQEEMIVEPTIEVPPLELDLRGQTVEEALEELERRLDAAFLAGMPFIRVIHGKGTGRLRGAIRQALTDNPYVASFEAGLPNEGGDGVTIIRLLQH